MKFALYQQEVQEEHVATPLKHRGPFPNNCYYSVHCGPKLSSKQLSRAEWKVACRPLSKENKNDVTVACISAPPTFFQNNTFKGKQAAKAALPSHRSVETAHCLRLGSLQPPPHRSEGLTSDATQQQASSRLPGSQASVLSWIYSEGWGSTLV